METTRPSLLLRIRDSQDDNSWRTFAQIYRPILLRYALVRGLSQADADDVAQHVLLVVHEAIEGFEYDQRKGKFKSWLRTVVNNHVRNMQRNRAVGDRARAACAEGYVDAAPTQPTEVFDQIWMQEHLWHCLRQIQNDVAGRDFEVFRRLVFAEATAESVSAEFGISPGNARTIKWRITRKLAERMRDLAGEESGIEL